MTHHVSIFAMFDDEEAADRFLTEHGLSLSIPNGGPVFSYSKEDESVFRDRANQRLKEIATLRAAVQKAEETFRHYGDLHAAKPDREKARRNYDLADEMRAALKETDG